MSEALKPTSKKERIVVLDVLRGFALVGILFANILSWSGIKFMPIVDIIELGDIKIDAFLYKLLKFFVDTKFYTIFSLLFGIGFSLQFTKNKNTPGFIPMYLRRLSILFLIGCIHAFFWSGDILTLYAILGFIFVLFRNIEEEHILKIAILFLALPVLLDIVYMFILNPQTVEGTKEAIAVYKDMTPREVVAGFQSGEWLDTLKTNWHNLKWRWFAFIPSGRPFKVLGLFLLGYYLYNTQFFNKSGKKWLTFFIFALTGISFTTLSFSIGGSISVFSADWTNILHKTMHEIGQISMSFSYIVLLNLLVDKFKNFALWNVLKAYGRKSLSSYLGHTFLGILVFYPVFGFDYFAMLSLKNVYIVALILLVYQFVFSSVWFRYFAFGPVEWLWKCLTYGKWFPIRIKKD